MARDEVSFAQADRIDALCLAAKIKVEIIQVKKEIDNLEVKVAGLMESSQSQASQVS